MMEIFTVECSIGIVLGIIGILASFYFYIRSRTRPVLSYLTKTKKLISQENQELPNEVEILFKKEKIKTLYLSQLFIWNSGNKTLDGEEIAKGYPLKFDIKQILNAFISNKMRSVNKPTVKLKKDSCNINFNFLDPKDGFRVDIYHTSSEMSKELTGTIKGMKKFKKVGFRDNRLSIKIEGKHLILLYIFFYLAPFISTIKEGEQIIWNSSMIWVVAYLISSPLLLLAYYYFNRKKYPAKLDQD